MLLLLTTLFSVQNFLKELLLTPASIFLISKTNRHDHMSISPDGRFTINLVPAIIKRSFYHFQTINSDGRFVHCCWSFLLKTKIISTKPDKRLFFDCFDSCIMLMQEPKEMILKGTCCTYPSDRKLRGQRSQQGLHTRSLALPPSR